MAFFSPGYTDAQKQQRSLLNQQGGQLFGNAQNIYSQIDPALQNILANPGYTPQQISDLTTGTLSPSSSGYSSAAENLGRIGARTNNTAGITSAQDQLAREAAAGLGTAGAKLSSQIADRPREETFRATQGLQSLYNPTLQEGGNLYRESTGIANNPKSSSTFSNILSGVGAAAGIGSSIAGMFPRGGGAGAAGTPGNPYGSGARFGGNVKKKRPVIVGEEGPELFVPPRNGKIIPNPRTLAESNIYGGL